MDTIRDSAFGKLVRLATRGRYLQYPEEKNVDLCESYLKPQNFAIEEEQGATDESLDTFGLYTVMSQASRSATRTRSRPFEDQDAIAQDRVSKPELQLIVDWRDSSDPEVTHHPFL